MNHHDSILCPNYWAQNSIKPFDYKDPYSKYSELRKVDIEKAITDALKNIHTKVDYPPNCNSKNKAVMNKDYFDELKTQTTFYQILLLDKFLKNYLITKDKSDEEVNLFIDNMMENKDSSSTSKLDTTIRGITSFTSKSSSHGGIKAYLAATAAKGTTVGVVFFPFLKAAISLYVSYIFYKAIITAYDTYRIGTDPNNKDKPYGMLIELFDKIIEHDKNPTTDTDFTPYGNTFIPLKTATYPLSYFYYPEKSVLQVTKILERYKLNRLHNDVSSLKKLMTWYDYSVFKLKSKRLADDFHSDPSNKLQNLLAYAKVKLKRAKNINVTNSKEENARVLRAIYWHTRIQSQKLQIFMTTKGISTYTKFLDRFLRTEFYLDFAKSSQDKTTRDKAKKESIYLSESFGSPNKGLNHASARAEFNFIIKATHKIPRLNYSWISSLIDIVFFKGIAKANHIEPSLRNMRSRVSIQQLKKENPKWHICDFFTYTNLEPSEQLYYRQENYKSCPFCYATIMAALRSKYGYTRYSMRTLGYGNYHEGTKAHKETLKILAEYSLTSKIKQRHTDYSHRGRFSNPVTKGGYIAQGTAYAFGLDPVMAFGPAWVHMAPSLTVTPVVTQALVGMAGGYAIADIFYAIAVYKIKKNSIKKAIAQVERVLQKIANHRPQGLSEYNLEIPGILAYNHTHAFELYEGLYRIVTDGSLLPDSATELQKYLENLEKSIELCSRLIQEEKTLTDKKRLEISNDALFYIFQTCKHFNQLAQDFFFIGLMYQTITFLTLGEHYYDKMAFGKEFYERTEDEKREFRKILDDAKIDSFTVSA